MSGSVPLWDFALMSFLSHPPISFSYKLPQEQVYSVTDHRSSSSRILTSFPQFNNSGIRSLRNYFVTLGMIVHDFRRLHFGQDSCTFLITSYRMLLSMVSWPK